MPMNAKWHSSHVLPRGTNDDARLAWHVEHQKFCGCRPIPASLLALAEAKKKRRRVVGTTNRDVPKGGNVPKGAIASPPQGAARASNGRRTVVTRAVESSPTRAPKRAPEAPFENDKPRCRWATGDALYARYHDEEWGRPSHDDRHLFEMLILEGAQAGLSWITILRKRENYRRAFDEFDARKIARFDARRVEALMANEGIVRNRLKIESTIDNARAFLETTKEYGSFDAFIWSFVGGKTIVNRRRAMSDVPPRTDISDKMSKELKRRGFRFVGSTICYAFMQATGLVNDHVSTCFLAPR